jgi:hypothetical protein
VFAGSDYTVRSYLNRELDSAEPFDPELTAEELVAGRTYEPCLPAVAWKAKEGTPERLLRFKLI